MFSLHQFEEAVFAQGDGVSLDEIAQWGSVGVLLVAADCALPER